MSKSQIKADLFRTNVFADAVSFWPVDVAGRDGPIPPGVCMIVDDASVRICSFVPQPELEAVTRVRDLLEYLARPVLTVCTSGPADVHTYVLVFDKRALVPSPKSATQQQRTEASETAFAERHGGGNMDVALARAVAKWPWKPGQRVLPNVLDAALPPWDMLRHRKGAHETMIAELGPMLAEYVAKRMPAGSPRLFRLFIDGAVVRAADDQQVLHWARSDRTCGILPRAGNVLGEADLAVQWWATWPPALFASESRGNVLLRTTDTDYLAISIAAAHADPGVRLYICFGTTIYVPRQHTVHERELAVAALHAARDDDDDDDNFAAPATLPPLVTCAKTASDAVQCRELYDVSCLRNIIHGLHPGFSMDVATGSMLAFCCVLGNDYIAHLTGMSYGAAWRVYEHHVLGRSSTFLTGPRAHAVRPLVLAQTSGPPVPAPRRISSFVRAIYHWMLCGGTARMAGTKRPRLWDDDGRIVLLPEREDDATWRQVQQAATKTWGEKRPELLPPTRDMLKTLWERIWWTVAYMRIDGAGQSGILPAALLGRWPDGARA